MKRIISAILTTLMACVWAIAAQNPLPSLKVDSISYDRHGDYMIVRMNMDLSAIDVPSNRALILTPFISSESGDTLMLHPVGIYGRRRFINYERNGKVAGGGHNEQIFKLGNNPEILPYRQTVKWEPWMDNSTVSVSRALYGCTNCLVADSSSPVTEYFHINPAIPEIVYFPMMSEGPKTETLEGNAYIDFIVDKTDIRPEYRNNSAELGKIQATIDTVINDKDVHITGIWLKGYASPESPYSHNTDLARGRTAALKHYIGQLYNLPANIITADFEPEDWVGLRSLVEKSNIDNKEEILGLIDSGLEPDAKEARIKKLFPKEYSFMLQNFYPPLRHTDYRITYEIRRFDELDKIRKEFKTRPSRLSLDEFFLIGNASEPGSDEFNEIFETAVRIFPGNEIANVNAANAALQRKDFVTAQKYLERAGNSQQAIYARGSLAFLLGDYEKAEKYMKDASSIPESQSTLKEIERIREHSLKYSESVLISD